MLDDVKHVEVVAILQSVIESPAGHVLANELKQTIESWLAANHPPPEAYMAAMNSMVERKDNHGKRA
jgi:hypothetical protein